MTEQRTGDRDRLAAVTAQLNARVPTAIADYLEVMQRAHDAIAAQRRAEEAIAAFSATLDERTRDLLQEYEDLRDRVHLT